MTRGRHEETHTTGFARYCLQEAGVSLRRRWRVALLSTLLLAAAVFVLATYLLASQYVADLTDRMNAAAELSVYMDRRAPPGARDTVETTLRGHRSVQSFDVIDGAQATERFLREFPELADVLRGLPDGPLGGVIEVRLSPEATDRDIDALVAQVRQEPGVDDVIYDRDVLARVLATVTLARRTGGVLALLLVLAATAVVAAVLRLAYYARRDEIEVLALLGAPPRAITGPFVVEGALQALGGATLALMALAVALASGGQLMASWVDQGDLQAMAYLSPGVVAGLVAGAVLAGAVAGWLAAREPRDRSVVDGSTGAN